MKFNYQFPLQSSGEMISGSVEGVKASLLPSFNNMSSAFLERLIRMPVIYPRFRISVLNEDETIKEVIPLEDIITGGSYSENYQNGQRRSLSITLNNEEGKYTPALSSFWVGSKFLLEIGMAIPDEVDYIIWIKKGVFVLQNVNSTHTQTSYNLTLQLQDKFSIFESNAGALSSSLEIPAETPINEVIKDLLLADKGNGAPLDPVPCYIDNSFAGRLLPQKITEQAGVKRGAILLKIASMLSAEMFYNSEGRLTMIPMTLMMDDASKVNLFNFNANDGDFSNNSVSLQLNNVVNQIVVIGANVNGHLCKAIATNTSLDSPLSINRIGFQTGPIIHDQNITADYLAQERADYELRKVSILKSQQSNTVYFNPLLTVNNIITITDAFYKLQLERFLLQSVSFNLDYNGTMNITTTNINNLPFITA